MADALAEAKSLNEIVPAVLYILARVLTCPSAAYYEIEGQGTLFLRYYLNEGNVVTAAQLIAGSGEAPYDLPRKLAQGFEVNFESVGTRVRENLKATVIDHRAGTNETVFDEWHRKHKREMELNIPLPAKEEALSPLTMSRSADRPFETDEIELAETLGKQLSLAVQAYRLAADSEATDCRRLGVLWHHCDRGSLRDDPSERRLT